MNPMNSEGPTLFPAAKPQGGLSLAQALNTLGRRTGSYDAHDTGGLLVIFFPDLAAVTISGVYSPNDLLEWLRSRGATISSIEENCHPTRPPLQQDLPFADPRDWFGGDDPPPDDAFL